MRKISINETSKTAEFKDFRLATIKLNKIEKTAEKELDMLAWGFGNAAKNLPPVSEPINAPIKKIRRNAQITSQRVYDSSEVNRKTWRYSLLSRIQEIKDDIAYMRDIARSKRELKRDNRAMKQMERADKREMSKTRVLAFLTGGILN